MNLHSAAEFSAGAKLMRMPLGLFRNRTLRAAVAFGSAGVAFALGNLMLAGSMPVEAYGRFALVISLFNIFNALAPMGLDQYLARFDVAPGLRLFVRATVGGVLVGALAGVIAVLAYELPVMDGALLGLALTGAAIGATAGGSFRRRGKVALAFSVTNLSNWAVMAAGLVGLAFVWMREAGPLVLLAAPSLLLASGGWLAAHRSYGGSHEAVKIPWVETFSLLGLQLTLSITLQLERLIAPYVLDIEAVAHFNVLASVAIFPFRTLAAAAGLMLVPRLLAARSHAERVAALQHETIVIVIALAVATVAILLLAPFVVRLLTGGKYEVGLALLIAGCINGCPKMLQALPQAVVTACGRARDLVVLNSFSWFSVVTGAVGAFVGARWDLEGLVVGAALGSFVMLLPAILVAVHVMRNSSLHEEVDVG